MWAFHRKKGYITDNGVGEFYHYVIINVYLHPIPETVHVLAWCEHKQKHIGLTIDIHIRIRGEQTKLIHFKRFKAYIKDTPILFLGIHKPTHMGLFLFKYPKIAVLLVPFSTCFQDLISRSNLQPTKQSKMTM